MKHLHTFESFLNESKDEIIFTVDDDKLDQILHSRFGMKLDYEDVKGDSYYSLPKRDFDSFIDFADSSGFDVDYDESEESVVYVYESTEVNEATSDTILYKVYFKPEYSQEDDSSNTPIEPVFVQMNTGERTKISNYAAIDKIGGYGKTTPDTILAKDRLDTTEMSFTDLFKLVKTLHKIKIYR